MSASAMQGSHNYTPQPFYGPFSRTTQVSRCQKRTSGTLWCKGRLTEADTLTTGWAPLHLDYPVPTSTIPHIFYRPDALPAAHPAASKH